ncbi:MAG: DUF1080 domain-containing protein [Planctomycetes bacterium]|nr:DUF1080 domain-containing protein [Planctomycetota bacterium]
MFRSCLSLTAFALALMPISSAAEEAPKQAFNGKNLDGWKVKDEKKSKWKVCGAVVNPDKPGELAEAPLTTGTPYLTNLSSGGTDIFTEAKFGDVLVEVEFMYPKGSNSGVYLMGEYEVQIIDSFGKPDDKLGQGDLGGIYHNAAPKKNAAKKPGEWQKFVIEFQAPKFEGDKKISNAKFLKVTLNDEVIHENVEAKGSTGGGLTGKEAATGPLMFQGDHGPVAFRNIKITPKK